MYYNHIEFKNGGNPYITKSYTELLRMIKKYTLTMTGPHTFTATPCEFLTVKCRRLTAREKNKIALREFAMEWIYKANDMELSWSDIIDWQTFFEEYGRRFGLLREFRENGIC